MLMVEENLLRKILLQLDPVDVLNIEKTSSYFRNLVIHFKVWEEKYKKDFKNVEVNVEISEKLKEVIDKADKLNNGNVTANDHWCFKLRYVHCWNLEENWKKGQYLYTGNELYKKNAWKRKHMKDHTILSTKYSTDGFELYCHKNTISSCFNDDRVDVFDPSKVVEVSDDHTLWITGSNGGLKVLLVENKSLEALGMCFYELFWDSWSIIPEIFTSVLNDSTCLLIVKGSGDSFQILVLKYELNVPKVWVEKLGNLDGCLRTCCLKGSYSVGCADFHLEVLNFDLTRVLPAACFRKVWELNISDQNSFPKIKFLTAFVSFPFVYVSKSNGILEVWDIIKNEVVRTVDKADILGSREEFKPCFIAENASDKVMCYGKDDLIVLDGKILKNQEISNNIGFRLQVSGRNISKYELFMDKTSIVGHNIAVPFLFKFDFWPVFPGNFKIKETGKCEVEQKTKKRKKSDPESSDVSVNKKSHAAAIDYEEGERNEEYEFKEDELYEYGDEFDEDHDQFYDDDNFVDDY